MTTWPSVATPTHSVLDGRDTREIGSGLTVAKLQADGPPLGSVDVATPSEVTPRHQVADKQSMSENAGPGPSGAA